jgi:hypothetical protein
MRIEISRPIAFNLVMSEALPFTNVGFAKSSIWWEQSNAKAVRNDGGGEVSPAQIA